MLTTDNPPDFSRPPSRISRRMALTITFGALAIVYALWNIPAFDFIVYPLRLFVSYIHEAGHSAMAMLTGGRVIGFKVFSDGSGLATTAGGSRALILPAGYLGAAAFGAIVFYLSNRFQVARTISVCLGAMLVIFSALFARPDANGVPFALVVGLLAGLGLITLGIKTGLIPNLIVLNVLAIMTALNAVLDLLFLIRNNRIVMNVSDGIVRNDAAAFSAEVARFIPPVVWALLWAGLAIAMIGAAVYFSIIRPLVNNYAPNRKSQSDLLGKMQIDEPVQ